MRFAFDLIAALVAPPSGSFDARMRTVCAKLRMPQVELEAGGTIAPEFSSSQVAFAVARTGLRRRRQLIRACDRHKSARQAAAVAH